MEIVTCYMLRTWNHIVLWYLWVQEKSYKSLPDGPNLSSLQSKLTCWTVARSCDQHPTFFSGSIDPQTPECWCFIETGKILQAVRRVFGRNDETWSFQMAIRTRCRCSIIKCIQCSITVNSVLFIYILPILTINK